MNFTLASGFGYNSTFNFVRVTDDLTLVRFVMDDAIISIKMKDEDIRRLAEMARYFLGENVEGEE